MGSCFSSHESINQRKPAANVVSVDGKLRQYSAPITVSEALRFESSSSPDSIFMCDSDSLSFDDFIPSLDGEDELRPDQIYFVLPINKLRYRLAMADMAVLALKASVALDEIASRRSKSRARISPVFTAEQHPQSNYKIQDKNSAFVSPIVWKNSTAEPSPARTVGLGVCRSRKLQRYSSGRAKRAVQSFENKLSTIYEGSVLHPS